MGAAVCAPVELAAAAEFEFDTVECGTHIFDPVCTGWGSGNEIPPYLGGFFALSVLLRGPSQIVARAHTALVERYRADKRCFCCNGYNPVCFRH